MYVVACTCEVGRKLHFNSSLTTVSRGERIWFKGRSAFAGVVYVNRIAPCAGLFNKPVLETTFPFDSHVAVGCSLRVGKSLCCVRAFVVGLLKTANLKIVLLQRLNV